MNENIDLGYNDRAFMQAPILISSSIAKHISSKVKGSTNVHYNIMDDALQVTIFDGILFTKEKPFVYKHYNFSKDVQCGTPGYVIADYILKEYKYSVNSFFYK